MFIIYMRDESLGYIYFINKNRQPIEVTKDTTIKDFVIQNWIEAEEFKSKVSGRWFDEYPYKGCKIGIVNIQEILYLIDITKLKECLFFK